jgi:hypothetical protein
MTDPFILSFRFYHLRGKGDATDTAADVLLKITVGTLADDMTETKVTYAVFRGTEPHTVEEIGIAIDLKEDLFLPASLNAHLERGVFALQPAHPGIDAGTVEIDAPIFP